MTFSFRTLLCAGVATTMLNAAPLLAAELKGMPTPGGLSGALGIPSGKPPAEAAPAPPFVKAPAQSSPPVAAGPAQPYPSATAAPAAPAAPTIAAAPGAPVTAAQATAAQDALRQWLSGLLGPTVTIAQSPVLLTPAGDHFNVVIPILQGDQTGGNLQITATAQPIDGGRWNVNDIKLTSPLKYTLNMPIPAPDGSGKTTMQPVTYSGTITGQSGTMLLDPSFATPTTWTSTQTGAAIHAEGAGMVQDQKFGAMNSVSTIKPAGPGRVDAATEGTIQGLDVNIQSNDIPPVQVGIKLIRVAFGLTGVSQSKASTLTRSVAGIVTAALKQPPAANGTNTPPKVAPEVMHAILDALQDVASAVTLSESFDTIAVNAAGMAGSLGNFTIGLDAKSDAGLLNAHMDLGAKGLVLPDLPLAGMEALIPQQIALRPFLSGVGVPELMRLATAASDGKDPNPADIQALFSHGGLVTGLESMTLSVAGATFTGQGKLVATAPDPSAVSGTAQITAENFDVMMQKVSAIPALAQQAIPVLALMKGIGHTVGDKIVWDISYKNDKILVNNVDLAAMGGAPPQPAPTQTGPAKGPAPAHPATPQKR